jgi:hypothetical protein
LNRSAILAGLLYLGSGVGLWTLRLVRDGSGISQVLFILALRGLGAARAAA